MFNEEQIKNLGLMVQLLTSLVEDMGKNIEAIYKELDMADGYLPMSTYDLCECDPQYGHICQDMHRV